MKNFFIPSPFDGRGIRERVKVCKRRFECNFPLFLFNTGEKKNKNKSLCVSL